MRTQSVTSLLGMQGCAISRNEHTHWKGRSAVVVHLGETGGDAGAGLWPESPARDDRTEEKVQHLTWGPI